MGRSRPSLPVAGVPVVAMSVKFQPRSPAVLLDRYLPYVFLLPAIVVLSVMLLFPLVYTVHLSFQEWFASSTVPPHFVGLKNYWDMLKDERFLKGTVRTIAYTILALGGEVGFGVAMALVFDRTFFGKGIVRALFLLPMVATPVAIALVWLFIYDPATGVLNYLLSLLGLPQGLWVSQPRTVIASLVLVDIWQWTPLVMLIVLAGLATLPNEPYEAATIDGASGLQIFLYITLPLLRPYIVVAALFRGIDALKTFDIIYVITRGGPAFSSETLNLYIYSSAFEYMHMGYSSAMLVVFFCLVGALSVGLISVRRARS